MKMKSKNNKLPETPTERNVGGPEDSWRGKTPPSVYPASDKESPISTSEMAVMGKLGGGGGGRGRFRGDGIWERRRDFEKVCQCSSSATEAFAAGMLFSNKSVLLLKWER